MAPPGTQHDQGQPYDSSHAPGHGSSDPDLEVPLLLHRPSHSVSVENHERTKPNFWPCTVNLTKVILGAGIMAMPKAISLLGTVVGVLLMLVVAVLTWFTVHGLVYASDVTGTATYSAVAAAAAGRWGRITIQAALALGCLGFEVVYIDIIGDVLLGDADTRGVLSQLLPPSALQSWALSRPAVLGMMSVAVLLPLTSQRHMGALGVVNAIGLGSLMLMTGSTIWLAGSAIMQGVGHALPLWPDMDGLGATTTQRLVSALGIIPMILMAMSCHQSVHPLRGMLRPYKRATLDGVVAVAVAFVTALFVVLTSAAYVAFGQGVKANFLLNLSAPEMAPLIGPAAAAAVEVLVRCGYVFSLLASCVLIMFPLRESVTEIVLPLVAPHQPRAESGEHGSSPHGSEDAVLVDRLFMPVTVALLAAVFVVAVFVPDVWTMIGLVGALSGTVMSFILPAICVVRTKMGRDAGESAQRALAWFVGLLGCALFVNGFAVLFVQQPGE